MLIEGADMLSQGTVQPRKHTYTYATHSYCSVKNL